MMQAQLNTTLVGHLDYEQPVNDVWGYDAPDGTEYALVGTQTGVSIVSLADVTNPVELFFIEGSETTWRDMKTWGTTAYSVCDNCPDGLLVIDLSDLPNAAPYFYWSDVPDEPFGSAHNIFIDEFGYGYLVGTNYLDGRMVYLDLFTTAGNPQFVNFGTEVYAHDVYVRDNILYASEVYEGQFAIYDVSDKSQSVLLATANTPSDFCHNAWLSDDSSVLFTTDERTYASTTSYDISDLDDIEQLDRFFSEASIGQATIPHNVHVIDDYLVISHYTDGCVIVDASRPDNLIEVGNYDTYLPERTGFFGAWGAYPYLPSCNILISDRQTGLYVVAPDYRRASYLEGKITDAVTGDAVAGAAIEIRETDRSTVSDGFGDYKTGIPQEGVFEVYVKAIFYEDKVVEATFQNGELTVLNIELEPLEPLTVEGLVYSNETSMGVANTRLEFESEFYKYEVTANQSGMYSIDDFYPDEYEVRVGKWSYQSKLENIEVLPDQEEGIDFFLDSGYEDNFLVDLGWEVSGEPDKGAWVREVSEGAYLIGSTVSAYLSPDVDVPEDEGNYCLLTGNGGEVNSASLQGLTRIASPPIDMVGWNNPKASFYYWFASFHQAILGSPVSGSGYMDFKIYNGRDTVLIDRFDSDPIEFPEWIFTEYKILDYIAATENMEFIFEANGVEPVDFDEAAVDFFRAWDDNADGSQDLHKFDFTVWPNPFLDGFNFQYDIGALDNAELLMYDVLGQKIMQRKIETTKGFLELGSGLAPGVYYLELRCDDGEEVLRVVKGQ